MNAAELVRFMDDYYRISVALTEFKIVNAYLDDPVFPTKIVCECANGQKIEHLFPENAPTELRLEVWQYWARMKGLK